MLQLVAQKHLTLMALSQECTLIKAAQRGDQQAFATLYRSHVDKIYRYILYRVESGVTAEDLTADVFMRALEGLARYECGPSPWIAWLYSIANARVIDHYRRNGRVSQKEVLEETTASVDPDLDGRVMTTFSQTVIQVAIHSLNAEQQQVVIYRFIEGYSLEKTATLLGKTIGAVKTMQHRALASMTRLLQKRGISAEDF
ncbi:MAG: RNA polymerase sigma factor [Aggregatilineales bacterium]